MSQAQAALGVTLEVGSSETVSLVGSGSDSFAAVQELTDVNFPSVANIFVDTTTHNNSTGFREWTPAGIAEIEEFTITVNLLESDASHGNISPRGLTYLWLNKFKRNMKMSMPGNDWVWKFGAFVAKVAPATPKDGVRTAQVTIKPCDYMDIT